MATTILAMQQVVLECTEVIEQHLDTAFLRCWQLRQGNHRDQYCECGRRGGFLGVIQVPTLVTHPSQVADATWGSASDGSRGFQFLFQLQFQVGSKSTAMRGSSERTES